jgi:hypothetical protein
MPKPRRRKINERAMAIHAVKPSPLRKVQLPQPDATTFDSPENIRAFAQRKNAARDLQARDRSYALDYDPVSGDYGDPAMRYYRQTGVQPLVNPAFGSFQVPNDKMRQYIYRQQRSRLNPLNWWP